MDSKKIGSIKEASFYGMLKASVLFCLFIITIVGMFSLSLSYIMMKSNEENLSNVLISNITQKENRLEAMCKNLAEIMESKLADEGKIQSIELKIKDEQDVSGFIILDDKGKVIKASQNYVGLLNYDFSEKNYYKKAINTNDTIISDPFVSNFSKKVSMSFVTPFKLNETKAFMVLFISPDFIQSSKEVKDVKYYVAWNNGEVIFSSDSRNNSDIRLLDSEIIYNMRNGNFKTFMHRDSNANKYMLTTIRADESSSTYVIIQHSIFGNLDIFKGIIFISLITIVLLLMFILLFSARNSGIITKYINILLSKVSKIEQGNYDLSLQDLYPYKEVNDFMNRFYNMAKKVNQREQELLVYNEELKASNDEVTEMISTINKKEREKQDQYIQIIHALLNLIEIKDEYTAGHSKMVTIYAIQIGERLNTEYNFHINIERLRVASILHDIGKIGISGNILNKPGKLTEEEYEEIKTHSIKGYNALKEVKNLKEETVIIKHHHERYDGKGYPDGLKGDAIPLGARIVCVADAYDAMTSDRPYRNGMAKEVAIKELIKNKGTQFDPFVVDVFLNCLDVTHTEAALSDLN